MRVLNAELTGLQAPVNTTVVRPALCSKVDVGPGLHFSLYSRSQYKHLLCRAHSNCQQFFSSQRCLASGRLDSHWEARRSQASPQRHHQGQGQGRQHLCALSRGRSLVLQGRLSRAFLQPRQEQRSLG